ncbi:MAG: PAS domain S-box protein [Rhodospirillales bacterium]|nr:PAS domain S-box protein [Rhodospirillales bacterium]
MISSGETKEAAGGGVGFWYLSSFWSILLIVFSTFYVLLSFFGGEYSPYKDIPALLSVFSFGGLSWSLGSSQDKAKLDKLLAAAAESDGAALLIVGPDREAVYANGAFHRLFPSTGVDGLRVEGGEASISAIASLVHGEASQIELDRLLGSAIEERNDSGEICITTPSGHYEWRGLNVSPIQKFPGYLLVSARDVTARHELEVVRRSEEKLVRDFIDHLPVGFFSSDADGRFIYVNETLANWLGIEPGEQYGDEGLADFIVGDDAKEGTPGKDKEADHGEVLLHGASGGDFSVYLRQSQRTSKSGDFVYSRSVVLRDVAADSGNAVVGFIAHKLKALFDAAPIGIAQMDISGEIVEANMAFTKMLGMGRDQATGKALNEFIKKEDRQDMEVLLSKIVMGTVPAGNFEVRFATKEGREKVSTVYAGCIDDGDGDVSGLMLHFIDTTERKHLEMEFTQSQRIQAVGQLAGGVAHDFNNLLTAMIGFCDLLLGRHGPGDPSFADVMQIKQNANRAANLVRQLLAFSRKQTLQPKVIDVTGAISEMSNLIRRLIGENMEFEIVHGHNLGKVRVDPGQFDQVVINLAVNARDAMPSGGKLTITTRNHILEQPEQRDQDVMPAGDYVLIEVADTGVGISKEDIGSIFEPFFSTKEVGAGTGLGLSTVHGIIHQTGGFIFVDSAPGDGTAFSIFLPCYEGGEEVSEEADSAPEKGIVDLTGVGNILLVEDEDAVRLFAARALTNKGYKVQEAQNAEEALDIIKENKIKIDLIVTDMVMPGMDGYTMVRYIRESHPNIKVILMSGYAEDAIPEEIGTDTTINFMHKPFSLKDLAALVKTVLGEV